MAAWGEFFPELRIVCRAAPDPALERAARRAAVELCQQSWIWQRELFPLVLAAGSTRSPLFGLPAGSRGIGLVSLVDTQGQPVGLGGFGVSDDGQDLTHPEPGADREATPVVALAPSRSAEGLPDWMLDDYSEALQALALKRLLLQRGTAWYAPELAEWYTALGRKEIAAARYAERTKRVSSITTAGSRRSPFLVVG